MTEDADVLESAAAESDSAEGIESRSGKPSRRQVSFTVRGLVVAGLVVALAVATGVLAWSYIGAEQRLHNLDQEAQYKARAEQTALNYATNAAAMNFRDMDGWKAKLVAGTSPELKDRLNKAATSMEQLLVPLQWSSTAQPLVAKVRSESAGTYVVDSFVSVLTKTTQAPEGLQSTATYSVTIDSNKDWQITDVAGISALTQPK